MSCANGHLSTTTNEASADATSCAINRADRKLLIRDLSCCGSYNCSEMWCYDAGCGNWIDWWALDASNSSSTVRSSPANCHTSARQFPEVCAFFKFRSAAGRKCAVFASRFYARAMFQDDCRPASRDASRGSFTARISVSKQVNNVETEDVPAETLTNTRDMIVAVLLLFVKCDQSFCRATLCIRAVYAVVQWLSVRLVRVLCRNG